MQREANFGGILAETFALVGDGIRGVAVYVAVLGGLGALGVALGVADASDDFGIVGYGFIVDESTTLLGGLFDLALLALTVIGNYLLLSHLLQVRNRLGDSSARIWAYVGLVVLSGLGIIVGLVLLVIPGIFLLVRWSAASGFLIGRRMGIVEALGASWEATKGRGWSIFFAGIVLFLAMAVVSGIFGGAALGLGEGTGLLAAAAFVNVFSNAVFLALGVAIYLLVDSGAVDVGEVFA